MGNSILWIPEWSWDEDSCLLNLLQNANIRLYWPRKGFLSSFITILGPWTIGTPYNVMKPSFVLTMYFSPIHFASL